MIGLRIANPAVDPGKTVFAWTDLRVHFAQLGAEGRVRIGIRLVTVAGEAAALGEEVLSAGRIGRVALSRLQLAVVLAVGREVVGDAGELERLQPLGHRIVEVRGVEELGHPRRWAETSRLLDPIADE